MPLAFDEATERPRATVDIFTPNPLARPWELEGEVIPELIRRVRSGWACVRCSGAHRVGCACLRQPVHACCLNAKQIEGRGASCMLGDMRESVRACMQACARLHARACSLPPCRTSAHVYAHASGMQACLPTMRTEFEARRAGRAGTLDAPRSWQRASKFEAGVQQAICGREQQARRNAGAGSVQHQCTH